MNERRKIFLVTDDEKFINMPEYVHDAFFLGKKRFQEFAGQKVKYVVIKQASSGVYNLECSYFHFKEDGYLNVPITYKALSSLISMGYVSTEVKADYIKRLNELKKTEVWEITPKLRTIVLKYANNKKEAHSLKL